MLEGMRHIVRLLVLLVAVWVGLAFTLLFGVEWGLQQLLAKGHLLGAGIAGGVIWLAGLLISLEHPKRDPRFGTIWTITMFMIGIIGGIVAYQVTYFLGAPEQQEHYTLADMAGIFLIPAVMAGWIAVVATVYLTLVTRAGPARPISAAQRWTHR